MKWNFVLWLVFTALSSCKEQSTHYTAKLTNVTLHNIIVLPYKKGVVNVSDTLKLQAGKEIEIANGNDRGLSTGPGFTSKYFGSLVDSCVIIFDNIYKVSHYVVTPQQLSAKYYLYVSTRNIGNIYSYKFLSTKLSKYSNSNTHEYTFTEDDYLYAK